MATIEKALQIAAKAHEGQKDKDGQPYILHPLRVMNAVDGEEAKIAAVLHDVIEDSPVTEEDLRNEGFSEAVITAVRCLTHGKSESYADYVIRCSNNDIACQVKLADLEDNGAFLERFSGPTGSNPTLPDCAGICSPTSFSAGWSTRRSTGR